MNEAGEFGRQSKRGASSGGDVSQVVEATGLAKTTVIRGLADLDRLTGWRRMVCVECASPVVCNNWGYSRPSLPNAWGGVLDRPPSTSAALIASTGSYSCGQTRTPPQERLSKLGVKKRQLATDRLESDLAEEATSSADRMPNSTDESIRRSHDDVVDMS